MIKLPYETFITFIQKHNPKKKSYSKTTQYPSLYFCNFIIKKKYFI